MNHVEKALVFTALAIVSAAACGGEPHPTGLPQPSAPPCPAPAASSAKADLDAPADKTCDAMRTKDAAWMPAACDAGRADVCGDLAWMIGYGHGVRAKADRAKAIAEQGCAKGDGRSCYLRAVFDGPPSAASTSWLEQGCMNGDGSSCFALGGLTAAGVTTRFGVDKWLEDGCFTERPAAEACVLWAANRLAAAEPDSVSVAQAALAKPTSDTATLGACDASVRLGARLSMRTSGCDFAMVSCPAECDAQCDAEMIDRRAWLEKPLEMGCAAKNLAYCHGLGLLRARGDWKNRLGTTLPADVTAADTILAKNCDDGFAPSCEARASLHESLSYATTDRETSKRELTLARELDARACDAKQPTACFTLSELDKSPKPNFEGYVRACQLGMKRVCLDLAEMYATGDRGAPLDPKRALEFARASR